MLPSARIAIAPGLRASPGAASSARRETGIDAAKSTLGRCHSDAREGEGIGQGGRSATDKHARTVDMTDWGPGRVEKTGPRHVDD